MTPPRTLPPSQCKNCKREGKDCRGLLRSQEVGQGPPERKALDAHEKCKKMAVKLAKRWGADPEKAAMAAILHDSAKELPKQELLQIFADNAIIAENAPARPLPVWHGIAAAILAETQWGITDPEILSAIRCHTTGKPGMSKLDKIIYLADMTSAERDWPGVDDLRALEMQDLDRALCDALKRSIDFVEEKGGSLDPESVAAYEYAKAHLE